MRKREQRLGEIGGYWLSRRPNSPAWCRTYFDPGKRQVVRVSLGTEDLEQAKLRLAEWVMAHVKADHAPPASVPLARLLAHHYEQHGKGLRSGDVIRYSLLRWNEYFKGAVVSEVTPERVRSFVSSMRGEGLSDGYIRRVLADGKAALNRAHREGEILAVPHVDLQLAPEAEARERVATIDEVAALFRAAETDHIRMYLLLAIGTAARPEAILQLTSWQVDCEARLIQLNPSGRRQTKKRRPTVPICDTLLPYLRAAPAGHLVRWTPVVPGGGDSAAPTKMAPVARPLKGIRTPFNRLKARAARRARDDATDQARRYRRQGNRDAAWQAIAAGKARAAGLMELTPYTLRHTVATELRRRGVPVWEVAGLLGHSSGYRTTERYAKFGADHLSAAVRAIDAYFADLLPRLRGQALGPAPGYLRLSCVLAGQEKGPALRARPLNLLVEPSGIEPLTSTMPL